MSPVFCRRSRS